MLVRARAYAHADTRQKLGRHTPITKLAATARTPPCALGVTKHPSLPLSPFAHAAASQGRKIGRNNFDFLLDERDKRVLVENRK